MTRLELSEKRARKYAREHGVTCPMGRMVSDLLRINTKLRKQVEKLEVMLDPPMLMTLKLVPGNVAGIPGNDKIADGCKGSGGKRK